MTNDSMKRDDGSHGTASVTAIWRELHAGLRSFVARQVANDAEVDDILQEVFLRVHRRLDQLNDPHRMTAWLYQIARNAVIDYYRSPARRRELAVGLSGEMEPHMPASLDTEDDADRHRTELAACIRPMLDGLSKEYREAVTMVEMEGLTQRAVAERLGLSVPGVKSRVQRGRRQLRQLLDRCCVIELDARRGIANVKPRNPGCDVCQKPGDGTGRSNCQEKNAPL